MPKRKTTRRKRRRVAVNKMVSVKPDRRRRATRKKGFLGDMVNPAIARGAMKATVSGAMGGIGAALLERMLANKVPAFWRVALPFVGGYVVAAFFKMPETGAGFAAVGANQLLKEAGMADNNNMDLQDHNYANKIKQLPPALDSYGQPMGENEMYLQDDNEMYLQDDNYQVGYAPDFASPTVPVTVDEI